jgi:tetratricopeptide (TPR) repeat protein
VFLIVWQAGLSTLAPAYPHGDSGETAGVALYLGIAHPPGYPLPTLLGNLFVRLLPVGCVAWRVSMLSLASAAGAAILLASAFKPSPPLFVLLGCAGGLALEVWNQMTIPKGSVYTVTILLLGLAAWITSGSTGTATRRVVRFGTALGLAAGGHYMILLPFVPFLAWPVLAPAWRGAGRWRSVVLALCAASMGLSLYLYLPLRAPTAHPMFRWAEPNTKARFSWLVLRQQYISIEKQSRGRGGEMLAGRFASRLKAGYGAGILLLGLGLAHAISTRRYWLVALAAGGVGEVAAAAFYPKLEADALWVADPFFTSGWYAVAFLAAAGIVYVSRLPGRRWPAAAALLALGLAGRELATGFSLVSKSRNYFATDQLANLRDTLPRDALLFCEGDAYIAPLLHGLYVDRDREDVRMIIPIFLHFNWGLVQLREQYPDLALKDLKPWGHVWLMARDIMQARPGSPWTYTLTTSTGWPFTKYATPYGLVYRLLGDKRSLEDFAVDRAMLRWRLRNTMSNLLDREPFARVVKDNYVQAYFARATYRRMRHEPDRSMALFDRARLMGSPEAALNCGLMRFEKGDFIGAGACWRQAAQWGPDRPEPWANLALLALRERPPRPDAALALCERCIKAKPDFLQAYEIASNAWYVKGDLPRAMASLERALVISPGDRRLALLLAAMRKAIGNRAIDNRQ